MNTIFVLMLAVAAQQPSAKNQMLIDLDARPRVAVAARPVRLVEPPPAEALELMQIDREKAPLETQPAGKPAPFPAEPKPPM